MENENMVNETTQDQEIQQESTQETVQETVQETAQETAQEAAPKKSRRQFRKEKKRAKKLARKKLRKEVRQRKKDEFRAKGCLGKIFWFFGKLIGFVVALLLIATVLQVNLVPLGQLALKAYIMSTQTIDMNAVTPEQLAEVMPVDAENAAAIDASAPIGEGETWAIYMYMVGSDLESSSNAQLSDATKYYTQISADNFQKETKEINRSRMTGFMQDIMAQGMDLPLFFYDKNVSPALPGWVESTLNDLVNIQTGDSRMATSDINEMLEVKLPENVKVVMQAGGAGSWGYDKINPNRTQRFVYDHEGMREVYNEQITSMARPETLADFLRYCKDEHPADHTMILFWNHGAGAFGFGVDTIFGSDRLTLTEMREAFESVFVPNEANPPIDIIGFDACLMASMEVAGVFNGFADYLVGSEDVEPGYGWDYTAWLGAMAENPQINPLQVCKAITDSYIEYYARIGVASKQPATQLFSILDLSKADDLEAAYGKLMARALDDTAEVMGTSALLGRCANHSIKYAGNAHTFYNTLDLGLFMKEAAEYYPDEANAVLALIDEMVLYNLACGVHKESTGVTVYYPATVNDLNAIQMALTYIEEVTDNEDIKALYYYKIAGCLRDDMQDYVQKMGYGEIKPLDTDALKAMTRAQVTIAEDQNYTVKAGEEVVSMTQSIEYNLVQKMGDGTARKLGSDAFVGMDENGDLFTEFEGEWLHIDGKPMPVKLISVTENMMTCSAKIRHNSVDSYLLLGFDMKAETWEILGVQKKEMDDSQIIASRNSTALNPGDTITPIYETYTIETGVSEEKRGDSITYSENTKVEDRALEDGEYISYISLTDARGDEYNLPVVTYEVKGGKMMNAVVGESVNTIAL